MGDFHFSPRPNRAAEIGWRQWSASAFEEARASDRPILLSISAVWCHWCHVMDETTYSSQPVIDLIGARFVPVRVDNDVRPDINQRYNMGGWPTTAFLTPGGDLLTGATYLPPDQMVSALQQVSRLYEEKKPEIAGRVLEGRKRSATQIAASAGSLEPGLVDEVLEAAERAYDPLYGGFGTAPKFPQPELLSFLAEQSVRRDRQDLMEMVRETLRHMAEGGTYDHVEGGFYRYSTTQDWSVPHFEKMLEDHAGLIGALAAAGMEEVLDSAASYLGRVLRDATTGLFAGSQDADEEYYALDAAGRAALPAPAVDGRVYTGWNCALAVAYLEADRRLGRPDLARQAEAALERLFAERFRAGAGLEHVEHLGGLLGDQAWGLMAAVRAHSAGLGGPWLERARDLARHLQQAYSDERFGGYFDRAHQDEVARLEDRVKPLAENSLAAAALLELDVLAGEPSEPWREMARRALESVATLPRQHGIMAAPFARALDRLLAPPVKVTTRSRELARAALALSPLAVIEPGDERAVVCVGTECFAPTAEVAELRRTLERATAAR